MRTSVHPVVVGAITLLVGGVAGAAQAQEPWSSLPGACASTDNNFYSGTPSSDYPVARFIVPGGSFTFNRFHDGYIAVLCTVDNPQYSGLTQRWNQLQVTYRDPDGLQATGGYGTEYQAYVELVRVSKTTGAWSRIARFNSNLQCSASPTSCQGDNTIKTFAVPFSHTFDFANYTYAVYARLCRALAIWGLTPQIYQLRLQAAPLSTPPAPQSESELR
jgi:hypothetical protein